jgi:hypothetical protein
MLKQLTNMSIEQGVTSTVNLDLTSKEKKHCQEICAARVDQICKLQKHMRDAKDTWSM